MSKPIIEIRGLGKEYIIGERIGGRRPQSFRDIFDHRMRRLLSRSNAERRESSSFWALRDIDLDVHEGDVIGVVGRNGAGKSTLLKVLSRITEPTTGRVVLRGRVASLLEVGTGFSGELTGRENIFLNGAILGMRRSEIEKKFDAIVAFAEVEKFIDTPVKRYSSGMYVRLAFAVAAHLEPDVMVIDEVLAVGDAAFQKKCLGKMEDEAMKGRTVLFVSHNMGAVLGLCTRGVYLDRGRLVNSGPTREIVDEYLRGLESVATAPIGERPDRKGNRSLHFTSYEMRDAAGLPLQSASTGEDLILAFGYQTTSPDGAANVHVAIGVHDKLDESLFHLSTDVLGADFKHLPASGAIICRIPRLPLQPGKYQFNLYCTVGGDIADWVQNAGVIDVEPGDFFGTGRLPPITQGPFVMEHGWSIEDGRPVEARQELRGGEG